MTLDQAQKNIAYRIKKINFCDEALKNRFVSFGMTEDTIVTLLFFSAKKSTLVVLINDSQIALRAYEAQCIEIENTTK